MPDIATIAAILSNLKVATDIAKALRASDLSMEKAELKLRLADMIGALADAKVEVSEVQQLLIEKERTIEELQEAFQSKDSLVKQYDAYYQADSAGKPTGEPFCASCWQVRHKKFNLQHVAKDHRILACVSCGATVNSHFAGTITPSPQNA